MNKTPAQEIRQILNDNYGIQFIKQTYQQEDFEKIVNSQNIENLRQIMKQLQIAQEFENDFIQIIGLNVIQVETLQETSLDIAQEKMINELIDLKQAYELTASITHSFSYKHLKSIKLLAFINDHPQLKQKQCYKGLQNLNIQEQIKSLKNSLKQEKKNEFHSIENILKKLEPFNLSPLQLIQKQIMRIDIDKLSQQITRSKLVGEDIYNTSAIVCMGMTGAGKSTAILSFLGHQMIESSWQGLPWITPKKLLKIKGVKKFAANPNAKSVTRQVASIQLPQQMIIKKQTFAIHLLDTQGWNDTGGSHMDLSNCYGTMAAILSLKQAIFVVIINKNDNGGREKGLVQIVDKLNQLFPNYENISKSIVILFSRYSQQEIKTLNAKFDNIYKHLEASKKQNANLTNIIEDIKSKTKDPRNVLVFDPKAKKQKIKQLLKLILEHKFEKNLEELVKMSFGERATIDLEKQSNILMQLSLQYFKKQKFQVCKYYYNQLEKLFDVLGKAQQQKSISGSLKNIKQQMTQIFSKKYRNIIETFNKFITNKNLNEQIVQQHNLQIENVQNNKQLMDIVCFSDFKNLLIENLQQNISKQMKQTKVDCDSVSEKQFQSFAFLLKGFKKHNLIEQLVDHFKNNFIEKKGLYRQSLTKVDYGKSLEEYKRCKKIKTLLNLIKPINDDKQFEIEDVIITFITETLNSIKQLIFDFSKCSNTQFQQIQVVSQKLQKLQGSHFLKFLANKDDVQNLLNNFNIQINNKASNNLDLTLQYLFGKTDLSQKVTKQITKNYHSINKMKNIFHIRVVVTEKANSITNRIKYVIQNSTEIIKTFIETLNQKSYNYKTLQKQINKLDQAAQRIERTSELQKNIESNLSQVQDKLRELFQEYLMEIKQIQNIRLQLSYQNNDHMKKLNQILQILFAFCLDEGRRCSKLFNSQQLINDFKKIKTIALNIFTNNIKPTEDFLLNFKNQREVEKKDHEPERYQKIKLKQISYNLKFINMGIKTFSSISENSKKFKQLEVKIKLQIVQYQKYYKQSIQTLLHSLKETQHYDTRGIIASIKKKVSILKSISDKYEQIYFVLERQGIAYIDQQFSEDIKMLFEQYQIIKNNIQNKKQLSPELSTLIQQCKTLSLLDQYIKEDNNKFKMLGEDLKQKLSNLTTNLDKRLEYSMSIQNYEDIFKCLEIIFSNKQQSYDQEASKTYCLLKKRIDKLKQIKIKGFLSINQKEPIIKDLKQFTTIKKIIECSSIKKTQSIEKMFNQINQIVKLFIDSISTSYDDLVIIISQHIKYDRLQQAYQQIQKLQEIEEIFGGFEEKLNSKQSQMFLQSIKAKCLSYKKQYTNEVQDQTSINNFLLKYKTLFEKKNVTLQILKQLKDILDQKIWELINKKKKQIELTSGLTKTDLELVIQLEQKLTLQFRNHQIWIKVMTDAKIKQQNWQKQKKLINQNITKEEVFDENGHINPKIIQYLRDKQSIGNINRGHIIKKIQSLLTNKIDQFFKQKMQDQFLNFVFNTSYIQKTHNIQNDATLNDLKIKYDEISIQINKKVRRLFQNVVSKFEQFTIKPQINSKNSYIIEINSIVNQQEKQLKQFLNYAKHFENKNLKNRIQEGTEKEIKILITEFCQKIQQYYLKCLKQANQISKQFKITYEEDRQKNDKLFYLRVIEQFIRLSISETSKLTNQIDNNKRNTQIIKNTQSFIIVFKNKMQYLSQKLILKNIRNIFSEKILSQYKKILNFSVKKLKNCQMNQFEIESKFKQIENLYKSKSQIAKIMDILGFQDTDQQMKQIMDKQNQLKNQGNQMQQQILNFASNPFFQNKIFEQINQKILIVQKFTIYPNSHSIRQTFEKSLNEYHAQKYETIENILKRASSQTKTNQLSIQALKKQNLALFYSKQDKVNKKIKQQLDNAYCSFVSKNKQLNDNDKLKKQDNQNIYKAQIKSLENQQNQKLKQFRKQLQQNQNNLKNKHQIEIQKLFQQIAKIFQKITTIQYYFITKKSLKQRNQKLFETIKNSQRKIWKRYLYDGLLKIGSTISSLIIINHKQFESYGQIHYKRNIKWNTIEQIFEIFKKNNPNQKNINKLKKLYDQCYQFYNILIKDYQYNSAIKDNLIKELKNKQNPSQWVKTIAKIFALWSILNSSNIDGKIYFHYNPHPVQILSILLLINSQEDIPNKFAQIQTGQGKSLILAILSCYFALKNIQIDCVSYSQNLSKRDEEGFKKLFRCLSIQNKIQYCTFNNLAEKFVNNQNLSLRQMCTNLINTKEIDNKFFARWFSNKQDWDISPKKVILIDEADVFFHKDYYGNSYRPSIALKSNNVKDLFLYIWRNKQQKLLVPKVLSSDQYLKVIQQFPKFQALIQNHIPHIVRGASNYKHNYEVRKGKIVYRDQDVYTDKITYRYPTVFANILQYQKKTIPILTQNVCIIEIFLCEISFAQLPKKYKTILGVTGTLKDLSEEKKQIMKQQYKIQHNYIIPSVYSPQLKENFGYKIIKNKDSYGQIIKNLQQFHKKQRPVIIFFQTFNDAARFSFSQSYKPFLQNTSILSQKDSNEDRQRKIINAMSQNKITLITRSFARGTDFIILQNKVIEIGGCHMICTFVIEQKSEQTQIIGRVGRQGNPGSYIFILTYEDLMCKLDIKQSTISGLNKQQIQIKLDEARKTLSKNNLNNTKFEYQKAEKKHNETIKLIDKIKSKQLQNALDRLINLNMLQTIKYQKAIRVIIAIDSTGSMSKAIQKIKFSLSQCFLRIRKMMVQKDVQKEFEIQIISYRNYNAPANEIIEITPFETSPQYLLSFIKNINAKYGWNNQALQLVYFHCLETENLNQLIILADAAANTKLQTIQKRNQSQGGQMYWSSIQKFNQVLDSQQLAKKLIDKKVLIHSLPIMDSAFDYFEKLSEKSSGNCQRFDPSSENATDILTHFISVNILSQLGKTKKESAQLVQNYQRAYKSQ